MVCASHPVCTMAFGQDIGSADEKHAAKGIPGGVLLVL